MSVRQRRRITNGSGNFTCAVCRSLRPVEVSQKYLDYWLERHPIEWIIEVADGIWGNGDERIDDEV